MMAQQGKKVLLIGCDPKSDTTSRCCSAARPARPSSRPASKKKLAGEAVAIGDVCFKRDGVFAMELGGPEVGRGCGGRGIIHGFETAREARLPRLGLRLRAARLPGRRGLRRLRPADRARHVPEGHRRRQQRPAVAVRRQQRLLGGRVLPQARRQRRRRRHGDQQGRRHRRGRRPSPSTPASRCWRRSRPTTTSAARAPATKSSAGPARSGRRCSRSSPPTSPTRRRCGPKPLTQDELLGLFSADVDRAATSCWSRPRMFDMCGKTEIVKPSLEVVYDDGLNASTSHERRPITDRCRIEPTAGARASTGDGLGCHAGKDETMLRCRQGGRQERDARAVRAATIRPKAGPHDQPQSMCPAFGSLRVGLRMRRTATILSGSACCVYGLTFTSHFYGARRTVGYVPFNSRDRWSPASCSRTSARRCYKLADPALYDAIVIINLCVPTASRRAAAAAAEGDQRRAHHRHRRAGLRRADACRSQGRAGRRDAELRAHRGRGRARCRRRATARSDKPTVTLLGEMFPADPVGIGMMLEPLGLAAGPVVPTREWRELYAALDCAAVAAIHPFYTASVPRVRSRRAARSSARRRSATTAPPPGCRRSARPPACAQAQIDAAKNRVAAGDQRRARGARRSRAASRCRGYEGSELLVGAAAGRERRRPALRRHRLPAHAVERSRPRVARGARACTCSTAPRSSRTSPRCASSSPTSPSAPRRWCRRRRSCAIPALYFTNLISARPLMGPAGAGSLAQVINAAIGNKARFDADEATSSAASARATPPASGKSVPQDRPEFRDAVRSRQLVKLAKKRKAEEMV